MNSYTSFTFRIVFSISCCLFYVSGNAQVGINITGDVPAPSAMLDISSNDKGILIPRMTTLQREAIANGSPDTALLVFDTDTASFWFYAGSSWVELSSGAAASLADQDDDTKVQVEKNNDDDIIRFDVSGVESMRLKGCNIFANKTVVDDAFIEPRDVFAKDIDGDGDIDLLAAARTADDVTWWENDGEENFTKITIISNFNGAVNALADDMDGDGDIDIVAAAEFANDVAWWQNDGNENFTRITIDSEFDRVNSIYIADVDSDGDIDVLGAATIADDIAWWENDGAGNFTKAIIDNNFNGATDVFATDLDGDGDVDVLGASSLISDIVWWENDGEENFSKIIIDNNFGQVTSVFALDMDGDGDMDVLGAAPATSDIAWWENDGSEVFTKKTIDNNFTQAWEVHAADLDNDGDIDVLGAGLIGNDIAWWENDGNQNFSRKLIDGNFTLAAAVYAADINMDGDIDILGASSGSSIAYWENDCIVDLNIDANVGIYNNSPQTALDVNGTVTATSFIGDGSALTDVIGDNLGDHIATMDLDVANFNLNSVETLNAIHAKVGNISLGNESDDQGTSNQAENGYTTTPWLYTNAIEAQGERGPMSTLITIGNDGTYGINDEIHLVTAGASRLQVDEDGRVGIGRDPVTNLLEINGDASKNSAGDWLANSDARLKKNVQKLNSELVLQKLLALQGITYEWADDKTGNDRPEGIQYGFTAQNIQQVFPTLVEEDAQGYLQTAYGTYDAMYVEAIRALQQQIQDLKTENQRLQKLETEVAKMKAMLIDNPNNSTKQSK